MDKYSYAVGVCCITQNAVWQENNNITVIIRAIDPGEQPDQTPRYCIERLDGERFFVSRSKQGVPLFLKEGPVWCEKKQIRIIDLDNPEEFATMGVAVARRRAAQEAAEKAAKEAVRSTQKAPESKVVAQAYQD
jgi:hypothetical protein